MKIYKCSYIYSRGYEEIEAKNKEDAIKKFRINNNIRNERENISCKVIAQSKSKRKGKE